MKKYILGGIVLIFTLLFSELNAQAPIFTNAKAEKVQLYFNGAEIQQSANVVLPKGTSEVVIMNVANFLDENSIQIKSTSKVTILSAQFSNQPIAGYDNQYVAESVRPIWDSIQVVEKEIIKNTTLKNSVQKSIEVLDKNQQLSSQTMNTAELSKLLDFHKTKRYELETQLKTITDDGGNLQKKLSSLKFRLGTASSQNANNRGKLVLQVMNEVAGKVPFQLNYVSYQALWNPFYEIRSEKINTPIVLKYNAAVSQNTGVDWNGVKLSLSSGLVNQQTYAPTITPWFIDAQESQDIVSAPAATRKKAAFHKNLETMELIAVEANEEEIAFEDMALNNAVVIGEKQFNTVFDIDIPYNILSNGKKNIVSLKNIEIPAEYKYYTVPKYDLNVYLIGNIENYGAYNLLPGEANLIFEGMYVGKTTLNPENASEKLMLSLGKDKNIRIERKLVSQNTENKSLSSKKIQTFTYEITVQNNKKEAVTIEIEDQIPLSMNKDIKVNLVSSDNAISDKEKGSLKWNLNLKPNQNQKVRFTYQVESDKDMIISNF
ncbi:MAG: DUF4139 domain-containing protein [Capnocytophaga sp.]|nr:DUF4139 domain-containing protein [Capnocytophaga sp.]